MPKPFFSLLTLCGAVVEDKESPLQAAEGKGRREVSSLPGLFGGFLNRSQKSPNPVVPRGFLFGRSRRVDFDRNQLNELRGAKHAKHLWRAMEVSKEKLHNFITSTTQVFSCFF